MRPLNKITHSAKLLLLLCYLPSFTLDCAAQVKSNDEIELQNLTVQRKPFDSELEQPILEEIIEFMKLQRDTQYILFQSPYSMSVDNQNKLHILVDGDSKYGMTTFSWKAHLENFEQNRVSFRLRATRSTPKQNNVVLPIMDKRQFDSIRAMISDPRRAILLPFNVNTAVVISLGMAEHYPTALTKIVAKQPKGVVAAFYAGTLAQLLQLNKKDLKRVKISPK